MSPEQASAFFQQAWRAEGGSECPDPFKVVAGVGFEPTTFRLWA
jgi:hypothetical protein